ncbi:hypothetical protein BDR07DRAFT_1372743 [Suillus spraguei]|nr:hypothetical protein BDR07DRAFT_1372743 [Suillus spraguei]
MPPQCLQVRHSERLKACIKTTNNLQIAMQRPFESKKPRDPTVSEPDPLRSQMGQIWAAIARTIFAEDKEYHAMYAEDNRKFALTCIFPPSLMNKYKKHCACFHQTGAGINPLDAASGKNLQEQVVADFPWFDALDALWKGNPAFAPKTILSAPGIDHTLSYIV